MCLEVVYELIDIYRLLSLLKDHKVIFLLRSQEAILLSIGATCCNYAVSGTEYVLYTYSLLSKVTIGALNYVRLDRVNLEVS